MSKLKTFNIAIKNMKIEPCFRKNEPYFYKLIPTNHITTHLEGPNFSSKDRWMLLQIIYFTLILYILKQNSWKIQQDSFVVFSLHSCGVKKNRDKIFLIKKLIL